MKRLFNLFAIGLLLAACDMEQQEPQLKVKETFSVECASYDFTDESGVLTKSVIGVDKSGSDGSQKVSNWNIWVYDHSTGNIVNNGGKNIYDETMRTFFTQTSGIDGDLLFPDENGHYDIYILTNVEQIISVPATATAAAAYNYTFQNYNSFKPENGGFPMATVYENFCPSTAASHTFMVKRLVSKYDVVIVNDIPDSDFTLSSVKLKQGAKKINPFQENSKISLGTEAGEDYDMFKATELVKKDAVTYIGELFMLENNQGQVFNSSVSTDKDRIPDNMIDRDKGSLCTFVEFAGNIAMKDGHGQNNITFRHYFGSGRNAGVMRNINTTVTLTLKSCPNDSDEDWRIVPDDPYDTRTVVFNPNPVNIVANGSWYDVTVTPKGGDPLVLNNYIEYRLECPDASSASLSFDGVTMGSTVNGQKTLRIKSNYSGSTPTTVKLYAYVTEKESYVSCLDINIGVQSPDVPIPYTNNAPTYDWQFGSINLSDAITSSLPVTAKYVDGNGNVVSGTTISLGSANVKCDKSSNAMFYIASSKTLYYYTTNGHNTRINNKTGIRSIVLSQEGHSDVTITPVPRTVNYTVDCPYTGSATAPVVTVDETGDDVLIPICYYDEVTGSRYYHSTFDYPYPVKSAFSMPSQTREVYVDYYDDSVSGFRYDMNTDYDDTYAGYVTVNGLNPGGSGFIDINSSEYVEVTRDMHLQIVVEPYGVDVIEYGEFHCSSATYPDNAHKYLTLAGLPRNAVLRHVGTGAVPTSYSDAQNKWNSADADSDYLDNIHVSSSGGKVEFTDPATNGGWYPCGSYIGKVTKTNPYTHVDYNGYYTFQIYQDVPIGIGVAFEQGTGSSTGSSFSWQSNRICVYPCPFMTAWNKSKDMAWDIIDYFPVLKAHFYYKDSVHFVDEKTVSIPEPSLSEGDYYEHGTWVYGESAWFQISGTWTDKDTGRWNVKSGEDTEWRVSEGLTGHGAFMSPKPLFKISLSSNTYWDTEITINDDNASECLATGGGWWYFYLDPSVLRSGSGINYILPIEQFYSDWTNF